VLWTYVFSTSPVRETHDPNLNASVFYYLCMTKGRQSSTLNTPLNVTHENLIENNQRYTVRRVDSRPCECNSDLHCWNKTTRSQWKMVFWSLNLCTVLITVIEWSAMRGFTYLHQQHLWEM